MQISTYNYVNEDLVNILNTVKDAVILRLVEDKVIAAEDYSTIASQYMVITCRQGWWGKVLDKVFGSSESTTFKILKIN